MRSPSHRCIIGVGEDAPAVEPEDSSSPTVYVQRHPKVKCMEPQGPQGDGSSWSRRDRKRERANAGYQPAPDAPERKFMTENQESHERTFKRRGRQAWQELHPDEPIPPHLVRIPPPPPKHNRPQRVPPKAHVASTHRLEPVGSAKTGRGSSGGYPLGQTGVPKKPMPKQPTGTVRIQIAQTQVPSKATGATGAEVEDYWERRAASVSRLIDQSISPAKPPPKAPTFPPPPHLLPGWKSVPPPPPPPTATWSAANAAVWSASSMQGSSEKKMEVVRRPDSMLPMILLCLPIHFISTSNIYYEAMSLTLYTLFPNQTPRISFRIHIMAHHSYPTALRLIPY